MKILSLIPFVIGLIGYDICMEESPKLWKYGPEYTFRLRVNTSSDYEARNEWNSNVTVIMKCRPFSTTSEDITNGLQCRIHNVHHDRVNSSNSMKFHMDSRINNKIFEIVYDKNGIYQLRIERPVTVQEVHLFRIIAHNLNLDTLEFNQHQDSFTLDREEDSIIGQCQTKIHVSTKIKFKSEQWNSTCGNKLHLETYAYGEKYPLIVINKTRDTSKCLQSKERDFGYNLSESSTSFTEFVIAPLSFGSLTINQAFFNLSDLSKVAFIREHIDLRLINIETARDPLKSLADSSNITSIEIIKF